YGWLQPTAALAPIYRDFTLAELRPLLAAAGIDATLLVQAAPTLAETRFLLDIAREGAGLVRGVVGWADLGAADAVETLGAAARDPLLRSVRPMLQDLADPAWITRPDVQPALAALPQLGLRFDALVKPAHLGPLMRVMEWQPDLDVVVDHCAKPDIAGRSWQPWADDLAVIAARYERALQVVGIGHRGRDALDRRRASALRRSRARLLRAEARALGKRL